MSFADQSLAESRSECMRLLARAVADRRAPMHTPSVATLGLDGRPRARVVVLRAFDAAARILRFHTDRRSEKFHELTTDPRIAILFYDAALKVQIRLEGHATLHHDDAVAEQAWQQSQSMSRHCYATTPDPGSVIVEAGAFQIPKGRILSDDGKPNFVAVATEFNRLEWLWLGSDGHRRARFEWRAGEYEPQAEWLVP
jgi:pyridoxamine 5'-phosphate oxidase